MAMPGGPMGMQGQMPPSQQQQQMMHQQQMVAQQHAQAAAAAAQAQAQQQMGMSPHPPGMMGGPSPHPQGPPGMMGPGQQQMGQGQPHPSQLGQPHPGGPPQGHMGVLGPGQQHPSQQGPHPGQGPTHPGQPHPGQQGQPHPGQQGQPHPGQQGPPHPGQQGQPHPGQQGPPHPGQQGQPHPGQQGQPQQLHPHHGQMDNISKAKTLVNPIKDALSNVLRTAANSIYANNMVDSGSKQVDYDVSRFDRSLEEFFTLCDQMEVHLKTSMECINQGMSSSRYLQTPVTLNRMDGSLTYPQYISVVKGQIAYAKEVHGTLAEAAQKLSE